MLTPVGPHLGTSTFYSPRLLSFCIRAIFTPILVKCILIKHIRYLISKHLVFCVWLCLVSLQVKTQPPVILLYVHGYRELSYISCLLINKQANPIGSLFFLNHFRNQLWESKFLRKQNTHQRPCINISLNSGQYENTGKQRWDTGMTNCQGRPTATWTLVHDEL